MTRDTEPTTRLTVTAPDGAVHDLATAEAQDAIDAWGSPGTPAQMVCQFHETFGLDMADTPALVGAGLAWQRQRLLVSEVGEVADAVTDNDLAGIAQELADVVYVAYGTALVYGIDLDAVLAAVHAANMTKLGEDGQPIVVGGKVLKGPNYRPPNVAGVLARSLRRPLLRTPAPSRTDSHFSPGYEGEIPDHGGVFETCPMPACVKSRAQHEAAGRIQDLSYAIFDGESVDGPANPESIADTNDAH